MGRSFIRQGMIDTSESSASKVLSRVTSAEAVAMEALSVFLGPDLTRKGEGSRGMPRNPENYDWFMCPKSANEI
jgi:hypothetical protein